MRIKQREKSGGSGKGVNITDKAHGDAKNSLFQDDGLQSNERNLNADLAIEKANKDAKDILLNEAAHILSDEVGLLKANPQFASSLLLKTDIR